MAVSGFLGIDVGTQGLSVLFTDKDLNVIATGDGSYSMVAGLDEGCYEQQPADWEAALTTAMADLRNKLKVAEQELDVLAIGIAGQMHGEVLVDADGVVVSPARLWCDSRNEDEGRELTAALQVKIPKRLTAARWLWTTRNRSDQAARVAHLTTPAGWISHCLTGQWKLGIGEASGMFPIDQQTLDYDQDRLAAFQHIVADRGLVPLARLLPEVKLAGDDGGTLNAQGARLLGIPPGIRVAPAEGDQPAALAGSFIGRAGMVSIGFGTSVCANSVGDRTFTGVSIAVDHFCGVDGKPINMVLLRNGTTFMNAMVRMFMSEDDQETDRFSALMQQVVSIAPDCGGVLALPFMDDEPGLGIAAGGQAELYGLNASNAKPANVIKAALLATLFNLKLGMDILVAQGYPCTELILTGGLTKTPELGQILADVMHAPVTLPLASEIGSALGAVLLARYRWQALNGSVVAWPNFLDLHNPPDCHRFEPDRVNAAAYAEVFSDYVRLLDSVRMRN